MKKIKLTIVIYFVFIGIAFSQDTNVFKHIQFKDYTPKWFYYVEDSTAIGVDHYQSYDYISQFKLENDVLVDSMQYCLYRTRLNAYFDGGYIEKRNIYTGEKIWSNIFDLRTNEINERPTDIILNEDGELEVFGFRMLERKSHKVNFNDDSKFYIRKFDPESGELLSFDYAEKGDTNAPILYPGGIYPITEIIKYKENKYQYVLGYNRDKRRYISYVLNEAGHLVKNYELNLDSLMNTEDVLTDSVNFIVNVSPLNLLNDSTFITTRLLQNRYSPINKNHKYRFYIDTYDRELNILSSIDVSDIFNAKNDYRMTIEYIDEEVIVIEFWNEPEYFNWKKYYCIFDHKGNLLDSINIRPRDKDDLYAGTITKLSNDEFLISGTNINSVKRNFTMSFYKKKIGSPIRLVRKINMGPTIYAAIINKIEVLENGDYLCLGTSGPCKQNCGNQWPFWMYIPAKDLEDEVAVDDVDSVKKTKFNLYPNPTTDKLNLVFQSDFTGDIMVIDELGRVLISKKVSDANNIVLDVSKIGKGLYFVRAVSDKEVYKVEVFVKD